MALAGPLGAAGGLGLVMAQLAFQLLDVGEHLVNLLALVLRQHLAVDPQTQPGDFQVDQCLCGVVLFQRPPRQPDGVAGRGQLRVLLAEANIDPRTRASARRLGGVIDLLLVQRLGRPC